MRGPVGENVDFEVFEPVAHTIPFVFNSPHSGRNYTRAFMSQSRLDAMTIRRSEDHYVEELFGAAVSLGAPMLIAHFPRAYLDVNREPYELDPRMFSGELPAHVNRNSVRVAGGLGTIPRIVAENMEIYRARLTAEEGLERIEALYKPYHACLRKLIARTHVCFGQAILIDCHSMPGNIRIPGSPEKPDIVIGDRYGTSASSRLTRAASDILTDLGFATVRNKPYAGGFITEHYGRPARSLHAIQIEVNRSLYVDETTLERKPEFLLIAGLLREFMARLADYVVEMSSDMAFAAE
jgi:N-formylglutamate deformylase